MPRSLRIAFIVGALAIAAYSFTRPRAVFSGDEGIKLVQVLALSEGQIKLHYPGDAVDPKRELFPYREPFIIRDGTERYGIYSITFTLPSFVGWWLLGFWGLYLLPLAGGMLALWYTLSLGYRVFRDEAWALACGGVLFTTPVVLNAAVFNEHVIATGLLLLAIARSSLPSPSRLSLFACGLAVGFAVTMRAEITGAVPALAAFIVVSSEDRRDAIRRLTWIAVGGSLPVAAYVAVNLATIGALSPLTHADYGPHADRYLTPLEPDLIGMTGVGTWVLGIPLALAFVTFRRRTLELARRLAIVAVLAVWLYVVVAFLSLMEMPALLPGTLFLATPLFALGLAAGPYLQAGEPRLAAALWCLAITTAVSIVIFYPAGGGLRLGPRYLIPVMPLFVIASLVAARRSRLFLAAAIVTTLVGLAPQFYNHQLHGDTRRRNAEIVEDVARLPQRYVISEAFWGKQIIAQLYDEKVILSLPNPKQKVMSNIRAQGEIELIEVIGGLQKLWWQVKPAVPQPPTTSGKVKVYRITGM